MKMGIPSKTSKVSTKIYFKFNLSPSLRRFLPYICYKQLFIYTEDNELKETRGTKDFELISKLKKWFRRSPHLQTKRDYMFVITVWLFIILGSLSSF